MVLDVVGLIGGVGGFFAHNVLVDVGGGASGLGGGLPGEGGLGGSGLEAEFAGMRLADDPDRWALAAYGVALARAEVATRPEQLGEVLALLERAGRILSAERAPLEHARILTASANCERARGQTLVALGLFERAAELLGSRAPAVECAAALVNLGLAFTESGQPERAVEALDEAVERLTGDPSSSGLRSGDALDGLHDESARTLSAALTNRAQAHQRVGSDSAIRAAVDDYRAAIAAAPPESPTVGMAAHGLGTALLELHSRRGGAGGSPGNGHDHSHPGDISDPAPALTGFGQPSLGDHRAHAGGGNGPAASGAPIAEAVAAFELALSALSLASLPFQHAIARHSLALAYEQRGEPGDTVRAVNSVEAALGVFDPRLHKPQWQTARATLARLERMLEEPGVTTGATGTDSGVPDGEASEQSGFGLGRARHRHLVGFLASTDRSEREQMLRDRLRRLAPMPAVRVRAELSELSNALAALSLDHYETVATSLIRVLMELPDPVLEAACASLCAAHQATSDRCEELDACLDAAIHAELFGPQRVRVRDLLEAHGWIRP